MTDETRTPALLIASETSHFSGMDPILRLKLTVVYLTGANEVRNYPSSGFDAHPLADLVIGAQYDGATANHDPYGWDVEYRDVFSADLRRVEGMVKTLRKIERGLEKLRGEWGYPDTFAAYVTRVAKVLGIATFGYKHDGRESFYDGNDYRWTDADGLRYRISELVAKYDKERERVGA